MMILWTTIYDEIRKIVDTKNNFNYQDKDNINKGGISKGGINFGTVITATGTECTYEDRCRAARAEHNYDDIDDYPGGASFNIWIEKSKIKWDCTPDNINY